MLQFVIMIYRYLLYFMLCRQTSGIEASCLSNIQALSDKIVAALSRKVDTIELKAICDDIHKEHKSLKDQCLHSIDSIKTDQEKLANKYDALVTTHQHANSMHRNHFEKLESQLIRHEQLLDSKCDRQLLNQISRDVSSHLEINQISLPTEAAGSGSSSMNVKSTSSRLLENDVDILKSDITKIKNNYQIQHNDMVSMETRLNVLKEAVEQFVSIGPIGSGFLHTKEYDTKVAALNETRAALSEAVMVLQKDISLKPSKQDVVVMLSEELSKRLGTSRSQTHSESSGVDRTHSSYAKDLSSSFPYEEHIMEMSRDLANIKLQVAGEVIGSRFIIMFSSFAS